MVNVEEIKLTDDSKVYDIVVDLDDGNKLRINCISAEQAGRFHRDIEKILISITGIQID